MSGHHPFTDLLTLFLELCGKRSLYSTYSNKFISRRQIESICSVGSTSAKYLIEKLLKEDYLEKVGNGPATKYKKSR